MKRNRFEALAWLISAACALMLVACTFETDEREIPTAVPVSVSPTAVRLPLTVGVYYSAEFKDDTAGIDETLPIKTEGQLPPFVGVENPFTMFKKRLQHYRIPVGAASVSLIDGLMGGMFQTIVVLQEPPDVRPSERSLNAVLIPSLDDVRYSQTQPRPGTLLDAGSVQYGFRFLGESGESLSEWTILGSGRRGYSEREYRDILMRPYGGGRQRPGSIEA